MAACSGIVHDSEEMGGFPVSRAINDPRDEGPDLIEPVSSA